MKQLVAAAVMTSAACQAVPAPAVPSQAASSSTQVANLHAFARLYGVLRWFHPSDAAAVIDWDRYACDGARRVIDAPDRAALRARLAELIAPIAPTVQIAGDGEAFTPGPSPAPPAASGREVVAWQHEGYGDTTIRTEYASKRRHRDRVVAESGRTSGALWQAVDAAPYRNARVRLRGQIRTANRGAGRLWLRVDRSDGRVLYDSMRERPVSSATWDVDRGRRCGGRRGDEDRVRDRQDWYRDRVV